MENGARRVYPQAEIVWAPLADGGEGTLAALTADGTAHVRTCRVHDPLDGYVQAQWAFLADGRAVIEMAQASGLPLIPLEKRDAKAASSYGTGQLIKAALDAGCREILVGIGGSATTDGGTGALSALGAIFRDEKDVVLPPGGAALKRLKTIDLRYFDKRLEKASITLLCDVTNPLCGENGAAHVYGPQKGATPQDVEILAAGLRQLADVSYTLLHRNFSTDSGAGAAGGLGFGLMAFCGARPRSGIEVVLEATHFSEKLQGADLVLTGEGALDAQTLQGKTIAGVCKAAKAKGVPVLGFAGKVALNGAEMDELGLKSAFPIVDGPRDLAYCLAHANELIETSAERALRVVI
jgi:glycerate kinase